MSGADGASEAHAPRLADDVPEAILALRDSELSRGAFDPLLETYIGFCASKHRAESSRVSDVERARYLEPH